MLEEPPEARGVVKRVEDDWPAIEDDAARARRTVR